MAKFIKSIFTPEKRMSLYDEKVDGETESPTLDERRKLSMSRSGRLKQAYKKRQQLSVDVYAGEDLHATEKPKSMEYHVNTPVPSPTIPREQKVSRVTTTSEPSENNEKSDNHNSSPEEEIDNAFQIIDKS